MSVHSPIRPQTLTIGLGYGNRHAIEEEIERLISLLDTFDGDCDLEDDSEDRCVFEDGGPDRVPPRDALQSPYYLSPVLPQYGEDQSLGPINEREVHRDHHRRLMAL